jgi:hypothetical protein
VISRLTTIALAVAVITISADARAQNKVTVTLPLGGHYRAGRYLPVRINSVGDRESITIIAPGAVTTEVTVSGPASDVVVPFLPLVRIGPVQVQESGRTDPIPLTLSLLPDESSLVGIASSDESAEALAGKLFPGRKVVAVSLDSVNPLPGPVLAWGALDAVLLDVSSAARVTDEDLQVLLAAGTIVAVRSDAKPLGDWRWQKQGGWWVVEPRTLIRAGAIQPEAYESLGLPTGRTAGFRRTIVSILLAFSAAAVGASLLRSRRAWLAVVAVAGVATTSLVVWNYAQPVAAKGIATSGPDVVTTYWANTPGEIHHAIPATGLSVPLLTSAEHARVIDLRLQCASDGRPVEFIAKLNRGQAIRFFQRTE